MIGTNNYFDSIGNSLGSDRRHVESFSKKMTDAFADGPDTKRHWSDAGTPGVKVEQVFERVQMKAAKAEAYRGLAALGKVMAQDRADIGFASKEVSKTMAAPAECDLQAM